MLPSLTETENFFERAGSEIEKACRSSAISSNASCSTSSNSSNRDTNFMVELYMRSQGSVLSCTWGAENATTSAFMEICRQHEEHYRCCFVASSSARHQFTELSWNSNQQWRTFVAARPFIWLRALNLCMGPKSMIPLLKSLGEWIPAACMHEKVGHSLCNRDCSFLPWLTMYMRLLEDCAPAEGQQLDIDWYL